MGRLEQGHGAVIRSDNENYWHYLFDGVFQLFLCFMPKNREKSNWAVQSFGLGLVVADVFGYPFESKWLYRGYHRHSDKLLLCFLHEANELHNRDASDYEYDPDDMLHYVFANVFQEEEQLLLLFEKLSCYESPRFLANFFWYL